ncbi:MAG TPA: translation initiation factor IF-2 N-terminal domain-containing protein [Candidatus Limnocylindrales bacterium]|nr:translation initiation factor IF-2 N-terminal domain-containing protein [Candidatus Limnocylindrales bacterium]
MTDPDYTKRSYLLPTGCNDLVDALVIPISKNITVSELASLLRQKQVRILADLFQLGVFASAEARVKFEIASKVAQKYGYIATKA